MSLVNFARAGLAAAALAAASAAHASFVFDENDDFLPTYTGVRSGDLDTFFGGATSTGSFIDMFFVMSGSVGQSPGASYVFGIDRGAGIEGLLAGTPPLGAGTRFDAVVVLGGDGSGAVTTFGPGAPVTTQLGGDQIFIDTGIVAAFVPTFLLPSTGFALPRYTINMWTRGGGGNVGIADLLSDGGNFGVTSVPEPATWAMLIGGFAAVGQASRRQRRTFA